MNTFTGKTTILLYAAAGVVSGFISAMGQYVLPDTEFLQRHYPPVILGITVYLCGFLLSAIKSNRPMVSLLVLIIFAVLGWRISIDLGYALGGPAPFVTAGALGAFVVAWGWLVAWGVPTRDWRFILTVTLTGLLGGLIFQIADSLWTLKEPLWEIVLFGEWQGLVLAGIAIAHLRLVRQNVAQ